MDLKKLIERKIKRLESNRKINNKNRKEQMKKFKNR